MKLYPSHFAVGDRFEFANRHGRVVLEAVTPPEPVRTTWLKDAPKECLISWEEVEQIALITDQVRLQPSFGKTLNDKCAFSRHSTTSEAGWVRVVSLEYRAKTPAKDQIESDMRGGRNRILT